MGFLTWIQEVLNKEGFLRDSSSQRRNSEEFVDLYLTHLEDRRVLNGAPPVAVSVDSDGVVTVDASQQATHDQHADVLRLERDGDQTQLKINDVVVYSARIAEMHGLKLRDSGDGNQLIVDFSKGNPVPDGGLTFEGGKEGGILGDTLAIQGGPTQSVIYTIDPGGSSSINVDGAVINLTASMAIQDALQATTREFSIEGGDARVRLSNTAQGVYSLTETTRSTNITFTDPTESLLIDVDGYAGDQSDSIEIAAFESAQAGLRISADASDLVRILGTVRLDSGAFEATAGKIQLGQTITSTNGLVSLHASQSITMPAGSSVTAANVTMTAPDIRIDGAITVGEGTARIDAGLQGTVVVSGTVRSEEHTSELPVTRRNLVCRLLLEKNHPEH